MKIHLKKYINYYYHYFNNQIFKYSNDYITFLLYKLILHNINPKIIL